MEIIDSDNDQWGVRPSTEDWHTLPAPEGQDLETPSNETHEALDDVEKALVPFPWLTRE